MTTPSTQAPPQLPEEEEERPPVFRTWNQLYAFVLLLHAVIIILFYLFTRAYS